MGKIHFAKNHHKTNLKCHLILCTKYRRKLLINELKDSVKFILYNISLKSLFNIDVMECDVDHIHFIIDYPPNISITSIVRKLKQESTIMLWKIHKNILSKYYWKETTFWSDGYFACSIGEVSTETVRKYI